MMQTQRYIIERFTMTEGIIRDEEGYTIHQSWLSDEALATLERDGSALLAYDEEGEEPGEGMFYVWVIDEN